MGYNAGTKVSIQSDTDGKVTKAVIVGRQANGTPTYRDNCPKCQHNSLTRHVLDGANAHIL